MTIIITPTEMVRDRYPFTDKQAAGHLLRLPALSEFSQQHSNPTALTWEKKKEEKIETVTRRGFCLLRG